MPRSRREQFAYSLLTRSQRISHENLRLRDRGFVARRWKPGIAARAGADAKPVPPMFTPFTLRGVTLRNRVVVSPMAQYSCRRRHARRLLPRPSRQPRARRRGSRVHRNGVRGRRMRASRPGCAGLYTTSTRAAWRRIVDYVHTRTSAKIALQLGHAGPKGSTQLGWEDGRRAAADGQLAADRAVGDCLRRRPTRCRAR